MNNLSEFIVSSECDIGKRLDKFLFEKLIDFDQNLTRNKIQDLILSGNIKINDKPIFKSSHKITKINEKYLFENLDIEKTFDLEHDYDFSKMIIFENEDFIIINKPSGLLSQSINQKNKSEICVSDLVKNYIQLGSNVFEICGEEGREYLVHRLDKNTSGLMIVPKNIKSFNFFKNQFSNRLIVKKYKGLVWGRPNPSVYRLENYLRRDNINRMKMLVVTNKKILNYNVSNDFDEDYELYKNLHNKSKIAITNYRIEKVLFDGLMSLVEFEIETGRTHQIRAQMSFFGNPIVCDSLYNGSIEDKHHLIKSIIKDNNKFNYFIGFLKNIENRHMLHSYYLKFINQNNNEQYFEFETKDDYSNEINEILNLNNNFIDL